MAWLNSLSLQQFSFEDILYVVGPSIIVIVLILNIISLLKDRRINKLRRSLEELQKTYEALDNQAKLIIKTDLELHKTQSELDKKISSLYTLQKISHTLSTTLDENEIFQKISEEHITELGFDKALVFLVGPTQTTYSPGTTAIKLRIGYNEKDIEAAFSQEYIKDIFEQAVKKGATLSSIDTKINPKHLNAILKSSKIQSFICAPITTKGAIVGILFVASESSYSPITTGDKEIVSILATQIGQSLENAQLFEETWRSHQELENKVTQRTRELSAALEEVKAVTKRKSEFVSAVSHELRTPLTSIKGYASLLSAGKLGELPQPVKERLEKINKHTDSLSQLINNMLDISRIESGRVEMKIEDIDLRKLLETVFDLLAPQFKEKQINFSQEVAKDISTLPADINQLQRIFINLLSNSLKFTPPDGKIAVRAKKTDGAVQIDVEDTGVGIAEKNLDKIFGEFYREDNEINQSVKGTGLGLSLVKYIVEAHKGKIWLTSKLNKGTTFSFTLPISKA